MNPIESLFPGGDPKKVEEMLRTAKAFLATPKGQEVLKKLEKDPSLQKKLREAQGQGISRLSGKDRRMILDAIGNKAEAMEQIKDVLEGTK